MCAEQKSEKIELSADLAVVFADQVCGVSAQQTAKKLGVHRNSVTAYRKRVNKFLTKSFDVDEFRPRMLGLIPLAIESLAYHLTERNLEATIKYLSGYGLLPKDRDELMEIMAAMAARSSRSDTHLTFNIGGDGDGRSEDDADLGAIFSSNASRFSNN